MSNMQVTIELEDAAAFIAQLVREGVTFTAEQQEKYNGEKQVVITFTGGY